MTEYPPQPGITIWSDGGHLVKQDGYNSSCYILSDLLALWIHAIW